MRLRKWRSKELCGRDPSISTESGEESNLPKWGKDLRCRGSLRFEASESGEAQKKIIDKNAKHGSDSSSYPFYGISQDAGSLPEVLEHTISEYAVLDPSAYDFSRL